jgi:hypothetical protein
MGSGGIAPPFLTSAQIELSGQAQAPVPLPPRIKPPILIAYEAGWAPEPVLTLWREEKSLAATGNRIPVVLSSGYTG